MPIFMFETRGFRRCGSEYVMLGQPSGEEQSWSMPNGKEDGKRYGKPPRAGGALPNGVSCGGVQVEPGKVKQKSCAAVEPPPFEAWGKKIVGIWA
jgi:hypothetical protein